MFVIALQDRSGPLRRARGRTRLADRDPDENDTPNEPSGKRLALIHHHQFRCAERYPDRARSFPLCPPLNAMTIARANTDDDTPFPFLFFSIYFFSVPFPIALFFSLLSESRCVWRPSALINRRRRKSGADQKRKKKPPSFVSSPARNWPISYL